MASSFEKSVKGGTKIKLAPPKSKYVEHILIATHAGEAGVAEIFRALQNRLRDSTWTVVFKSLIIIHLMIREGEPDVTLKYLSQSPKNKLAINHFTEVQTQGRNIRTYSEYLLERAKAFGSTKVDYVKNGEGRLKRMSVDKGLLRETESVQHQIAALVRCEMFAEEPENEITLTAFRLLTMDLLALFHVMNEGTINVLEHYFEMSHTDAQRALNIYRIFCRQTELVVQYLSVARLHEHSTRLEIPKIKHAPTSLAKSLEEYLNDKDFEINRRQYLAEQQAKKGGKGTNGTSSSGLSHLTRSKDDSAFAPKSAPAPAKQEAPKAPAPDLIDFFESIEQNQQPLGQPAPQFQQAQFPQQTGYVMQQGFQPAPPGAMMQQPFATGVPQATNPFGQAQQQQLQPNFTGAGFGGYTPQPFTPSSLAPIPQDAIASFPQQQQQQQQQQPFGNPPAAQLQPQPTSTNPFRASTMMNPLGTPTSALSSPSITSPASTRSSTNPFAKPSPQQQQSPAGLGIPSIQAPQMSFSQPQTQSLQPTPTGTNPFARSNSPSQSPALGLVPNPTGSTNPFRQSAFVNQQTGHGWQSGQGTIGGLEHLETVPVFPRPGQQQTTQQQGGWQ